MENCDDASLRADELEALSAIYGDALVKDESSTSDRHFVSMTVHNEKNTVELTLFVKVPTTYPSLSPPTFEISSPYLDGIAKKALSNRLEDIYSEHVGQPVLYHWFEACREFLDDERLDDGLVASSNVIEPTAASESTSFADAPSIQSGDPLTDRKSTFQAHLASVTTKDDVQRVLAVLQTNSKVARATHNIYAYRIYDGGRICVQDCDDDGESQAGSRLLHLLEIMDARNVCVVVSRWYGGVHLGPDRFKHICNVARDLLENHGYGKQQGPVDPKKAAKKK